MSAFLQKYWMDFQYPNSGQELGHELQNQAIHSLIPRILMDLSLVEGSNNFRQRKVTVQEEALKQNLQPLPLLSLLMMRKAFGKVFFLLAFSWPRCRIAVSPATLLARPLRLQKATSFTTGTLTLLQSSSLVFSFVLRNTANFGEYSCCNLNILFSFSAMCNGSSIFFP